jgi:hypothetical protein
MLKGTIITELQAFIGTTDSTFSFMVFIVPRITPVTVLLFSIIIGVQVIAVLRAIDQVTNSVLIWELVSITVQTFGLINTVVTVCSTLHTFPHVGVLVKEVLLIALRAVWRSSH